MVYYIDKCLQEVKVITGLTEPVISMTSIYNYTDYRKFISDYFAEQKRNGIGFSYAFFAKKAGFKSRSFMAKVISGEKALSAASIGRVAKAMDLQKKERDYFRALVLFNNEKSLNKKIKY